MRKGKIIVLSAPSGTGKGTVVSNILKADANTKLSVSATTRAPRPGEVDGVNYYYITREKFHQMISEDAFIEHAEYNGNCYGTPKAPLYEAVENGINVILEIEIHGALQIMEKLSDAISVFLAPPSMEELERRLRGRGTETEEEIQGRLSIAKKEMTYSEKYDYVVVNNDSAESANVILDIIYS